jgi:hypothetical protein
MLAVRIGIIYEYDQKISWMDSIGRHVWTGIVASAFVRNAHAPTPTYARKLRHPALHTSIA